MSEEIPLAIQSLMLSFNSPEPCTFSPLAMVLSLGMLQAIVLMLFNDSPALKFTDIKEASGIDDAELRRTLQSLALGKSNRVLIKEPKVACRTVRQEYHDFRAA